MSTTMLSTANPRVMRALRELTRLAHDAATIPQRAINVITLTDRRFSVARKWSNRELRKVAPHFVGAVVNVSGWDDRDKEGGRYRDYFAGATEYRRTNFEGHNGFQGDEGEIPLDLTMPLPDQLRHRFDVVFNHTTLEHIFEVRQAFDNLCAISRDVVIVVVPFCQIQHETVSFRDYWRFTPTCMRELFKSNGFEVLYESETPFPGAATYLFHVASRNPEKYKHLFPNQTPLQRAGHWIGRDRIVSLLQFARARIRHDPGAVSEGSEPHG